MCDIRLCTVNISTLVRKKIKELSNSLFICDLSSMLTKLSVYFGLLYSNVSICKISLIFYWAVHLRYLLFSPFSLSFIAQLKNTVFSMNLLYAFPQTKAVFPRLTFRVISRHLFMVSLLLYLFI